jgi:hypothetical protein
MNGFFRILSLIFFIFYCSASFSQYNPEFYLRPTETAERQKTHDRLVENVIRKNFALPLDSTTEENWEGAMNAMEVVSYHDAMTWKKMQEAMSNLAFQSLTFQRHALEAAYTVYPGDFIHEATDLIRSTADPKIFAMCAVYLLKSGQDDTAFIVGQMRQNLGDSAFAQPILSRLLYHLRNKNFDTARVNEVIKTMFSREFLPGQTIMYSIQRKNRDFPGLVIIRKGNGEFVTSDSGIFHVSQLARGIANLPYYLTKGNTPQGIYRMFGFGVSQSQFIGPTANVQMGMPIELSKEKFFARPKKDDDKWTIVDYANLLPASLRTYEPLYESFYAGSAGRNEIIAHGTTINPEFYRGKPFYPMTPSEGCLSTSEIWDGKLIYSGQEKLVNALLSAGGAKGYAVVIETGDQQSPVSIKEILKLLPKH